MLPNAILFLRRLAFKAFVVVSGLVLLPVLNMILNSTTTDENSCPGYHYWDYQTNQSTFLGYFSERKESLVGCVECTRLSMLKIPICGAKCSFNSTYKYVNVKGSNYVNENDLTKIYTIPNSFLEIFFLVIFLQMIENIFSKTLKIIQALPAPSKSVEIKFASILEKIKSSGGYIFTSYNHKESMYYFNFTQIKLFILFFTSLIPIFPIPAVSEVGTFMIPIMFSIVSFVISLFSGFTRPYRSILHNIINGVSYFVGGIASFITVLAVRNVPLPEDLGNVFFWLIFIVPIFSALISPFIFKPSRGQMIIPYELRTIIRKDRQILPDPPDLVLKKPFRFSETSDSNYLSIIDSEDEYQENFVAHDFNTEILAPIHVQMGLDAKYPQFNNQVHHYYYSNDLPSTEFNEATTQLFNVVDSLLDTVSYQGLLDVLSVATIICSLCVGYGFGAGIAQWKSANSETHMKCDWLNESLIPNITLYTGRYSAERRFY